MRPGLGRSIVAEATSALMVQRWLLTGEPVDDAYADEVLDDRGPAARAARSLVRGACGPRLPAEGAGLALERADDVVGDPAAVEAAGLRPDGLAVDEGPVDLRRDRTRPRRAGARSPGLGSS